MFLVVEHKMGSRSVCLVVEHKIDARGVCLVVC